jgi:YHS domain-containing protein
MKSLQIVASLTIAAILSFGSVGCKSPTRETASARPYPLQKCVVSDEAFVHGKPYTFVRNGQEVKLCCKDCLAEFNKNPEKFMAKINEAR